MTEKLALPFGQWQSMRRHLSRNLPREACGLLAGRDCRVEMTLPVPNAEHSPTRFRMDPLRQWRAFERIDQAGLELLAIYHSHPQGPDHPSPSDIAECLYPVVQVICFRVQGRWQARGFRIEHGIVTEISLEFEAPV
jgi:proteasome lid subunit RPN8/RPN11